MVPTLFIGKWTVKIMYSLRKGPRRHGQLRRGHHPTEQHLPLGPSSQQGTQGYCAISRIVGHMPGPAFASKFTSPLSELYADWPKVLVNSRRFARHMRLNARATTYPPLPI